MTENKVNLVINKMTKAIYNSLLASGQIYDNQIYCIIDDNNNDNFYYKDQLYTKEEIDSLLRNVSVDLTGYATETYVQGKISELVGSAPGTLDTIQEIASALEGQDDVITALELTIGSKANSSDVYTKTEMDDILSEGLGGSSVIANPELDGGEEILESIQIEDTKYSLQGQDMTFSESVSEDPEAKILKTITIGTDDWKVDKGSVVTPNVELTGDEPVLESVQIDDNTFTLKGEEMIFSETAVEGATVLRNIQLGDDNWAIPEGGSVDLTGYATETYVDTKVSELVNSAPDTLNTLGELATALQENQGVVETLDSAITNKLDKSTIVYSETEPENPILGMIWLKPAQ